MESLLSLPARTISPVMESPHEARLVSSPFLANGNNKGRISDHGSASGSDGSTEPDDVLNGQLITRLRSKLPELLVKSQKAIKESVAETLLSTIGFRDSAIVLHHLNSGDNWNHLEKECSSVLSNFYNQTVIPVAHKQLGGCVTPVSPLNLAAASSMNSASSNLNDMDMLNPWVSAPGSPVSQSPHFFSDVFQQSSQASAVCFPQSWAETGSHFSEGSDLLGGSFCNGSGSILQALSNACPESQHAFAELLGQVSTQFGTDPSTLLLHLESLTSSVRATKTAEELSQRVNDRINEVCRKCGPYIKAEHFDSGVRHWLVQIQSLFGEVHALSALEALEQAANLEGIRKMKAFITTRLIDHYEHLVWAQDPEVYARGKLQPEMYAMLCELIHSNKGLRWSHFDPKVLDAMREVKAIDAVRLRLQKLCMKELAGVNNVPAYLYTLLNKRTLANSQSPIQGNPCYSWSGLGNVQNRGLARTASNPSPRPPGGSRTAAAATASATRAHMIECDHPSASSHFISSTPINASSINFFPAASQPNNYYNAANNRPLPLNMLNQLGALSLDPSLALRAASHHNSMPQYIDLHSALHSQFMPQCL